MLWDPVEKIRAAELDFQLLRVFLWVVLEFEGFLLLLFASTLLCQVQ
jgi:hypothetical protein